MTDYGDSDPEDAWDESDPPDVKLDVLKRIVESIKANPDHRQQGRRKDAARLAVKMNDLDYRWRDRRKLESLADELEALDG